MAIASVGTLGTGVHSTSATSFTLTTVTNALAAGDFAILSVVTDNTSTTDANSSDHTSVTGGTGTWTKLGEYTNGNGAAEAGVTTSLWLFEATGTNAIGTVITMNLATARIDKAAGFWKFTKAAGNSIRLVTGTTNPINNGVDAANDFGSVAFSGLASASRLYYRALGKEANSTTNITPSTNFTAGANARSRNSAAAVLIRNEFRVNTSTGETSNPTLAVSGDTAGVFAALEEYIPVAALTATNVATAAPFVGTPTLTQNGTGITFVAVENVTGSGTSIVVNKPTGTANGDMLVMFACSEQPRDINTPSGWTAWSGNPIDPGVVGYQETWVFYKVASSEPASYTVTMTGTSAWLAATVIGYRNVSGIGDITGDTVNGATNLAPSFTQAQNSAIISAWTYYGNADVSSAPSSGVERLNSSPFGAWATYIREETGLSAGTSTPLSLTINNSGYWLTAIAVELLPAAGGASVDLARGAFTLAGQSQTVTVTRAIDMAAGAFTLTGRSMTVAPVSKVDMAAGSFAVAGQNLTATTSRSVEIAVGSLTLAGHALTQNVTRPVDMNAGAFTLTGQSITAGPVATVDMASGAFTLAGQSVAVVKTAQIGVAAGSFTLAGQSVSASPSRAVDLAAGSFTTSGPAIGTTLSRAVDLARGQFTLAGNTIDVATSGMASVDLQSGAFTLAGQSLGVTPARVIEMAAGAFSMAGASVLIAANRPIAPAAGSFTWSGQALNAVAARPVGMAAGGFTLAGQSLAATASSILALNAGAFVLGGLSIVVESAADYRRVAISGPNQTSNGATGSSSITGATGATLVSGASGSRAAQGYTGKRSLAG